MSSLPPVADPWVLRSGRWLTKRRSVLLPPLFVAALLTARPAGTVWAEVIRDLFGLACLLGGTRLRLVAASYHDSSESAEAVTAGPYAWVRHPLYLANFLLGLGIVLVAGWWPMVAAYVLVFLPMHILIARSEEVHLVRLYGATYEAYRRAVPAVLPWRRFRGKRYGTPSRYKLQNSQEGLKSAGYLAGLAAVLVFKYWRQGIPLPALAPLPAGYGVAAAALALFAVVMRQRVRSHALRAFHTVLAVLCVCLMVIHLPGAWISSPVPSAPPVAAVQETQSAEIVEVQPAAAPLPPPGAEAVLIEKEPPRRNFWAQMAQGLSSNFEIVGGLGGFGLSALAEGVFEGDRSNRGHGIEKAGWVGLAGAAAMSLFAQLRHSAGQRALPGSSGRAWQMGVQPQVDEDNKLALLATFKRRF